MILIGTSRLCKTMRLEIIALAPITWNGEVMSHVMLMKT